MKMSDRDKVSAAIIRQVERDLRKLLPDALILKAADFSEATYVAKAAVATDPALAEGYRKLARKAAKRAKKAKAPK